MKLDRSNWTIYYNETFSFWGFLLKNVYYENGRRKNKLFMFHVLCDKFLKNNKITNILLERSPNSYKIHCDHRHTNL